MCDTFGVTARTLRFSESKDLLSPLREGPKRLYTRRDRARLKLILRGKRFGFLLERIRQLLDLYDVSDQQKPSTARQCSARLPIWMSCANSATSWTKRSGTCRNRSTGGADMLASMENGLAPPTAREAR